MSFTQRRFEYFSLISFAEKVLIHQEANAVTKLYVDESVTDLKTQLKEMKTQMETQLGLMRSTLAKAGFLCSTRVSGLTLHTY